MKIPITITKESSKKWLVNMGSLNNGKPVAEVYFTASGQQHYVEWTIPRFGSIAKFAVRAAITKELGK